MDKHRVVRRITCSKAEVIQSFREAINNAMEELPLAAQCKAILQGEEDDKKVEQLS